MEDEKRIAIISIFVYDRESSREINGILNQFGDSIIGRMGIPYPARNVNIISVAIDAPASVINAVTGKLGMIEGVTAKTLFSKY